MIKEKEKHLKLEVTIDLTGPNGNVFYLIGCGVNFCRQLGLDGEKFAYEMMSKDYDHAVKTFDEHFGHFVTLLVEKQ
jgi:hypothetical protein